MIFYSDPYVPTIELSDRLLRSVDLTPALLHSMDCSVVLTNHSAFDYTLIATHSPLIVDSRNALKDFSEPHIFRL